MGKSGLFKRGYKESRAEQKRQDELREKRKGQIWRLFLKDDGEEVTVRFLTEEPVTFHEHSIQRRGRFDNVICTDEGCPHCENGDSPQFKGAYLVWDYRKYKNRDGKTIKGTLRLYVAGTKIISQLDRIHSKYGLTNRDITITRIGKGTSTSYAFDRGDEEPLTKREIEAMIPDALKDIYNGTAESLYAIVENALESTIQENTRGSGYDDDDDTEDGYDEVYDDDEDDNNYVDDDDSDDDEDEYVPLKKSSRSARRATTSKSSAKSLFNKKRKR